MSGFGSHSALGFGFPPRFPSIPPRALLLRAGIPPSENFELHVRSAIEFIELWGEGQIEPADGQRAIAAVPKHGLQGGLAVGDPKPGVFLLRPHALQGPGMCDPAQDAM